MPIKSFLITHKEIRQMTILKVIALASVLMLPAITVFAEENSQLVSNLKAGKRQVIVAYGTSLTEVGDWVNQLQEALNAKFPKLATVVNSGMCSMASPWGVENLDARVIWKNTDTVLIEFAINDAYQV